MRIKIYSIIVFTIGLIAFLSRYELDGGLLLSLALIISGFGCLFLESTRKPSIPSSQLWSYEAMTRCMKEALVDAIDETNGFVPINGIWKDMVAEFKSRKEEEQKKAEEQRTREKKWYRGGYPFIDLEDVCCAGPEYNFSIKPPVISEADMMSGGFMSKKKSSGVPKMEHMPPPPAKPKEKNKYIERPEFKIHDLKCYSHFFQDILSGQKKFELRKNDRGYEVGHILVLNETTGGSCGQPLKYTGKTIRAMVTYVLHLEGFPQGDEHVIMGIKPFHYYSWVVNNQGKKA